MKVGYIYDVVLLLSSSLFNRNFARISLQKIISITPFLNKSDSNYHCNWESLQM